MESYPMQAPRPARYNAGMRIEPIAACLLLSWRLASLPVWGWAGDWITAGLLLWVVLAATPGRPGARRAATGAAALWLLGIYARHQGPHTFHWPGA
jgi:1,6-anhydro-N-acetylmuramate kinase